MRPRSSRRTRLRLVVVYGPSYDLYEPTPVGILRANLGGDNRSLDTSRLALIRLSHRHRQPQQHPTRSPAKPLPCEALAGAPQDFYAPDYFTNLTPQLIARLILATCPIQKTGDTKVLIEVPEVVPMKYLKYLKYPCSTYEVPTHRDILCRDGPQVSLFLSKHFYELPV